MTKTMKEVMNNLGSLSRSTGTFELGGLLLPNVSYCLCASIFMSCALSQKGMLEYLRRPEILAPGEFLLCPLWKYRTGGGNYHS